MTEYLSVKNWEQFQHYKDRSPPWIKLHRELLRDYEFSCLQDASKLHLMLIWLLASQLDNKIPADPEWIRKQIGVSEPIDLSALINSGYLIASKPLAACKQVAMLETEAEAYKEEAEAERKPRAKRRSRLSADWEPSEKLIDYCKTKRPDLDPATTFENFKDYYLSHGRVMADWDLTAMRWVRNERPDNGKQSRIGPAETAVQRSERKEREALRAVGVEI